MPGDTGASLMPPRSARVEVAKSKSSHVTDGTLYFEVHDT
jgi:hypothetical protein